LLDSTFREVKLESGLLTDDEDGDDDDNEDNECLGDAMVCLAIILPFNIELL
jgi:hypothetical protein